MLENCNDENVVLACKEAEVTSKRSTSANEEAERKRAENATRGL